MVVASAPELVDNPPSQPPPQPQPQPLGHLVCFSRPSHRVTSRLTYRNPNATVAKQDFEKRAALRRVAQISARRFRQAKARAFHRWQLATAEAAMDDLRQQQHDDSLGRGAVLSEAILRRRDSTRLRAGFHRWTDVCAKVRRRREGSWTERVLELCKPGDVRADTPPPPPGPDSTICRGPGLQCGCASVSSSSS